jgi:hypothetical protein
VVAGSLFAATESSPVTLAGIAAFIAAVFGGAGWLLNKRSGDVTRSLGFIDAAQESQAVALTQARADILDLRAQVEHMREELRAALAHAHECDEARVLLEQQVIILRAQLEDHP